ncbi:MAG: C39 family peptidase [Oscillospiraceae bacterium]|nr:C39 family peptidase [Oscillospiraceae bacterium]
MKKRIAAALAALMAFSLAACGDSGNSSAGLAASSKAVEVSEASTQNEIVSSQENESIAIKDDSSENTEEMSSDVKPNVKESRVVLPVKNIQQNPELPNGSEITSAAIVLNYYGIKCDKTDLLDYLPMSKRPADSTALWVNPNDYFCGDPRETVNSYGCYSPVLKKTIDDYLAANKISDYTVEQNMLKNNFDDFYTEIDNGCPVIIWGTVGMKDRGKDAIWSAEGNFTIIFPENEQCMVLIGYDKDNSTLIFSDPLDERGTVEYPVNAVKFAFNALSYQSIIIRK